MEYETIESSQNRHIKLAASLRMKKYRDETGLFVIEGEKFVAGIPRGVIPEMLICTDEMVQSPAFMIPAARKMRVARRLFEKLSDTKTPQGIMAVCKKIDVRPEELLAVDGQFIVADGLSDPGNMGTVIRTAAAAGVSGVFVSENSADPFSPKCLRASASAVFQTGIALGQNMEELFRLFARRGVKSYAACMDGESLYNIEASCFKSPLAVIIGSEGNGVSECTAENADKKLNIPMQAGVESLNAAVAASIIIYEIKRKLEVWNG